MRSASRPAGRMAAGVVSTNGVMSVAVRGSSNGDPRVPGAGTGSSSPVGNSGSSSRVTTSHAPGITTTAAQQQQSAGAAVVSPSTAATIQGGAPSAFAAPVNNFSPPGDSPVVSPGHSPPNSPRRAQRHANGNLTPRSAAAAAVEEQRVGVEGRGLVAALGGGNGEPGSPRNPMRKVPNSLQISWLTMARAVHREEQR